MASDTGVAPGTPVRDRDGGPSSGSLTELAALEAGRDEKKQLLRKAAELAVTEAERGAAALPQGCTAGDVPAFFRRYYWSEPAEEVLGTDPADLAALALGHLALAEVRPPGAATVDVRGVPGGRGAGRTVIRLVTDDMPYLVDSVTAEVTRQGFALEHVVHPVLVLRRDVRGRVLTFCDSGDAASCGADALAESWMAIVLDGPLDAEAADDLVAGLRTVLDDVRAVHEDAGRMRDRLRALAARVEERPGAPADVGDAADDPAEAAALLRWLADENFVLLGAREVTLSEDPDRPAVQPVAGTGLGVLRSDTGMGGTSGSTPETASAPVDHLLTVTKADSRSTVHRRAWLDLVSVTLPDGRDGTRRQCRFVGLFPTSAYTTSVLDVPLVRRRVGEVIARSGVPADSHTGKELLDVLETYPRDELMQVGADQLLPVAMSVLHLQERRQTRLFLRRDPTGRFWSALVYLPRDRYTTEVRVAMQQLLLERLGGTSIEFTARSTESVLARLHFVVRPPVGRQGAKQQVDVDVEALQAELAAAARSWTDELSDALAARFGADAEKVFARIADAFPAAYQEDFSAQRAVEDLVRLDGLAPGDLALRLSTPAAGSAGERRLTVYRVGERLLLSQILPMLQNMGVDVVDERPYEIDRIGAPPTWIYDFGVAVPPVELPLLRSLPERFTEAVGAVWRGEAEDDGLGALVVLAGLNWRQVTVVRAYVQWLRQAGLPFSQAYVEQTLAAHPGVVARLVALFETRFSPGRVTGRDARQADLVAALQRSIGEVASLDADRVLSSLLAAVTATQRTTYYASTPERPTPLALKLAPAEVPDLPEPRPAHEVWVSSPRVMGVHLRFGKVARGGLRWSDRREDLRTEVLGLVKAQMVKNTVIVPTGAKGGFVVKRPPADSPTHPASREEVLAEGQACYRSFVGALLSLTDNLVDGAVVPPEKVVRHDGDDSYLVVAADKGTATFSDLANEVALERGYWLGDAFASGGSVGYDHKAMGITARGAWESVTRYFRELDVDVQQEDFTVAGIGDMSGDVFGNGMLLSEHIRLVAAFDHRHVFVDPTPDAATSFAERRRLFELPRSSWADYDTSLISEGGGVWPRTAKTVPVSEQVRAALGLPGGVTSLSPVELIRAVLLAPVDLLFNGGIGTYVKAAGESHLEVGDKANDAVRVDGRQLRARVVGEGGNLGLTQRGRVEYALAGGRVNTDAIDNSAGVDTSDHEVNIKIALNRVVDEGRIDAEGRAALLGEMADDVAAAVLTHNHAQNATLAGEAAAARSLMDSHERFIRSLERTGRLNRAVEALPDDRALTERRRDGHALTSPELSVLLAYAKLETGDAVLASPLPDDPALEALLVDYFPGPLRGRFPAAVTSHPLRREIIATVLTNRAVDIAGVTGLFRLAEETGVPLPAVVRAHAVARAVFGVDGMWDAVRPLDNQVSAAAQVEARTEATRLAERAARWLLRQPELTAEHPPPLAEVVDRFAPAVTAVEAGLPGWLLGGEAEAYASRAARLQEAGLPAELAARVASAPLLPAALDLAVVAERTGAPVTLAGQVMQGLAERLGLVTLREQVLALPRDRRWPSMARASLRDDLAMEQSSLTEDVLSLRTGDDEEPGGLVGRWAEGWDPAQRRAAAQLADITAGERHELAELLVAVRTLRGLRKRRRARRLPRPEGT
ncbi:NAD-glutamate dehydrogenase [Blastococcus sp. MG754426]|uniref:NAD-glutamate dehydrogenase n=1 Tax=unclassified Blastococcus TaxID=2619396 RepID=UPI001EF08A3E|nr:MULTISPECIES: NAD-glutamate dehydrogenase [unclassified Blastococcus]MCF6506792.1 NAD-glutamate dehydrogenase [Blastococcus sp. MG754426]MCF6511363.1 NAD-glutamate dehydrogenase [Blastococcus sp. MG754427]MCF6734818.1 NAD-glutamate dehydrogenase [Blastococcus sp. KM273129]